MYCPINEAWPQFIRSAPANVTPKQVTEHFEPPATMTCDDFMKHLESCPLCSSKIKQQYGNKIYELFTTNPQLKETLIVFLIGIVVILVLNLFYK